MNINISNIAIFEAAIFCNRCGLRVLPADLKGKRPLGLWGRNLDKPQTESDVHNAFLMGGDALCIVCGGASGGADGLGLFMMDFDQAGKAFGPWKDSVPEALFSRLVIETTQHGGRHAYWRSSAACVKSEKFARDDGGVLIESRCEKSVSICAPTPGYALLQGDFAHIPVLSAEEHAALVAAARALDRRPQVAGAVAAAAGAGVATTAAGDRPGDEFNASERGLADFRRVLEGHGWACIGTSGENEHWRRPGKEGNFNSADFNGKTFHVFSTNAAPFEASVGYSPFHAYALLEHGGDFSAAAASLAARGYGKPRPTAAVEQVVTAAPTPEEIEEARQERVRDPGVLPESLCRADGWIGEVMDYTLKIAHRPNVRLAFGGALSACAHVAGCGHVVDTHETRPNLYILALGDSGSGKSAPRKTNKLLAAAIGRDDTTIDSFGSGQGLEDCFVNHHAILCNFDEFHKLLAALKDQNSALAQGMAAMLLQLYTESDQIHTFRKLALTRQSERGRRPTSVQEPHLTLFATGIPSDTFGALSPEAMTGGLASRCILIEAGERGKRGNPERRDLPHSVITDAEFVCRAGASVDANILPFSRRPRTVVEETDDARRLREELTEESDRLFDACPANERGAADRALYSRQFEKAAKVALVLALGSNMRAPKIEKCHLQQAWDIVSHSTERMRFLASRYLYENAYDALAKRAMRFLSEAGATVTRSALMRGLHVCKRDFDSLVETLTEARQIVAVSGARAGAVCYRLT